MPKERWIQLSLFANDSNNAIFHAVDIADRMLARLGGSLWDKIIPELHLNPFGKYLTYHPK
jgi:hypothetical protein